MKLEDVAKEREYLAKEHRLQKRVVLRNKWPIIDRLSPRSPAFSSVKYQINREDTPLMDINEFQHIMGRNGRRICVYGLSKSGNVWLMNLITDALGLGNRTVMFTHRGFQASDYFNNNIIKGVCLMRDMRDIFVSLFHFSSTIGMRDDTCIFDDIERFYFEYFISYTRTDLYGGWEQHAERYVGWGLPLVKYEKLWDDPQRELGRLFKRWHLSVPSEMIEKSIEKNSLEKYKSGATDVTEKHIHTTHFRKGGHGGYINEIPPNVIADINTRFGRYLERWGYTL